MYHRQYIQIDHGEAGIISYDLYATMNFITTNMEHFHPGHAGAALDVISRIRTFDAEPEDFITMPNPQPLPPRFESWLSASDFWLGFGCAVNNMHADEEYEYIEVLREQQNDLEARADAHLLWNLFDDGDDWDLVTVDSYDTADIEELLQDEIGEVEV